MWTAPHLEAPPTHVQPGYQACTKSLSMGLVAQGNVPTRG